MNSKAAALGSLLAVAGILCAQTPPAQYVNPLSIEDSRSIADPTILHFKGTYYLFLSGGAVWTSKDLVHWAHHAIRLPDRAGVAAPNVFEYRGKVYLSGNDVGFYRASDPLGPWEYAGDIHDEKGNKKLLFDSMGFIDEDGKPYLYYSGTHSDGIWGVALDPGDITRFAGPARKLFTFNPAHVWERYGDNNEGSSLSWIEAPWMTKHNGTYYLQYSSPGTEWKTYSVAVYTGRGPLGPFQPAARNPVLVHRNGLINGTGHHCVVEGPDGRLWAAYTILYRNHSVFDRRIGLDPAGFDKDGNLFVNGPSEEPRWGPGGSPNPATGNATGSIAVSLNRYTWAASSMAPGRDPTYAFDNNVRTWWEPDSGDSQPWLMLDLGCRNGDDPNQEFTIDSARILFDTAPQRTALVVDGHDRTSNPSRRILPVAYQYRLEASLDNKTYQVIVDKTRNSAANNVEFDRFAPVPCRYIRLTLTGKPKNEPTALLEFTVFGKP
ncbi:MAG: family 43 glycosylhydrolase [Paludibaculum sp.]